MPHLAPETLEGPFSALRGEDAGDTSGEAIQAGRSLEARWSQAGAGCCVGGRGAAPEATKRGARPTRRAPR